MSSYDITFCATECNRRDCRRNWKFQKIPLTYVSMSEFDKEEVDKNHEHCKDRLPV